MSKGQKSCRSCGEFTGPRALKCASCGTAFEFKPKFLKKKPGKEVDWTHLKKGDKILVKQGSGPFWKTEKEKVSMGYHGKFIVSYLDKDGIHAYGNKKEGEQSHCFIFMGAKHVCQKTGMRRRPHKIRILSTAKERWED